MNGLDVCDQDAVWHGAVLAPLAPGPEDFDGGADEDPPAAADPRHEDRLAGR